MNEKTKVKRKYIRFTPEPNTVIWLSKNLKEFEEQYIGLVDGESHGGSSFTINQNLVIKEGDFLLVKVGKLMPMMAEVRWIKSYDDNLYRIGLMYLE